MTRTFIMLGDFYACWKDIGLNDDDLRYLEQELLVDPEIGDRIPGTGGIRKHRIALEGRGKRGGARVCYYDIPDSGKTFLITAYAKNEKVNLSKKECTELKKLTQLLLKQTKQGGRNESL